MTLIDLDYPSRSIKILCHSSLFATTTFSRGFTTQTKRLIHPSSSVFSLPRIDNSKLSGLDSDSVGALLTQTVARTLYSEDICLEFDRLPHCVQAFLPSLWSLLVLCLVVLDSWFENVCLSPSSGRPSRGSKCTGDTEPSPMPRVTSSYGRHDR